MCQQQHAQRVNCKTSLAHEQNIGCNDAGLKQKKGK
jgi:hypothetical protein